MAKVVRRLFGFGLLAVVTYAALLSLSALYASPAQDGGPSALESLVSGSLTAGDRLRSEASTITGR